MLWSFERFDIGRPRLRSYEPYEAAMYHLDDFDPIDRPTMGSIWTKRNVSLFQFKILFTKVSAYINSPHYFTAAYVGDGYRTFDLSGLCRRVRPAQT